MKMEELAEMIESRVPGRVTRQRVETCFHGDVLHYDFTLSISGQELAAARMDMVPGPFGPEPARPEGEVHAAQRRELSRIKSERDRLQADKVALEQELSTRGEERAEFKRRIEALGKVNFQLQRQVDEMHDRRVSDQVESVSYAALATKNAELLRKVEELDAALKRAAGEARASSGVATPWLSPDVLIVLAVDDALAARRDSKCKRCQTSPTFSETSGTASWSTS